MRLIVKPHHATGSEADPPGTVLGISRGTLREANMKTVPIHGGRRPSPFPSILTVAFLVSTCVACGSGGDGDDEVTSSLTDPVTATEYLAERLRGARPRTAP
jgi:hypothetical protein